MNNNKPEKWELDESDLNINTWIQTEANSLHGHVKVARIYHGNKTGNVIDYQANLIMNAPETLYKLQEVIKILKLIPEYTQDQVMVDMVNAVIKDFE